MKKKICMIVPKGLPVPAVKGGAIETIVTNIIEENEKQNKLDLTVVSIFDEEAYNESKKYKNTKFIYIKSNLKYYIKSLIVHLKNLFGKNLNTYNEVVLDYIKKKDLDYVFIEDGAFDSFYTYPKYFTKNKLVLHFHHVGKTTENIEKTFSKFIGVSSYAVNAFKEKSHLKETYVLLNGIKVENFDTILNSKDINNLREKLGVKKDDYLAIFCGRLIKEKGILELVRAIKLTNEKIKLLIVGSASFAELAENEFTKQLKAECENNNRVIFTGYIDNKELYKYYNIADVMVVPSVCEEAAGLVCIEGMISKKTIISTGAGGIKEYLKDYGVYVANDSNLTNSLAQKLEYVYNNQDKFAKNVDKAYKYAKQYSTLNYYNNLVDLINQKFK